MPLTDHKEWITPCLKACNLLKYCIILEGPKAEVETCEIAAVRSIRHFLLQPWPLSRLRISERVFSIHNAHFARQSSRGSTWKALRFHLRSLNCLN